MPRITITLIDMPDGRAPLAVTDGDAPAVGRTLTPAQALAMDLLRTCKAQAREVRYGADQVPLVALAHSMLDPEALGYAVPAEVRDRARVALGRNPVEQRDGGGY